MASSRGPGPHSLTPKGLQSEGGPGSRGCWVTAQRATDWLLPLDFALLIRTGSRNH